MSTGLAHRSRLRFDLPVERSASEPPESRGLTRDGVRLLVAGRQGIHHATFRQLPHFLRPGDLLVVNTSATLPAAVDAYRQDGSPVAVHFSTPDRHGGWVVEMRHHDAKRAGPVRDGVRGERLALPGGACITLVAAFPEPVVEGSRLWRAETMREVPAYLQRHGRPIRYGYVHREWPMSAYQTVFATQPGSAEMPSAGRPFSAELVAQLVAYGVLFAPVVLHTGVSSLDVHEPPYPERYDVPTSTARLVEQTRAAGRRVIAVGTTVVRALETAAAGADGVRGAAGWTDLVIQPAAGHHRAVQVVDGMVTGWHAPEASHLSLLEAVAGADLVRRAYAEALRRGYLWHEFGDSCLLLP